MAFPAGATPALLFSGACALVFVGSFVTAVVLSYHGWPVAGGSRFNLYQAQKLTLGIGISIALSALFTAAVDKLSATFDLNVLEAAFSASLGLGLYVSMCAAFYLFVTKFPR